MTDQPSRHFWQVHLSTAVLMMFAAGITMWFSVGQYLGPGPMRQSEWVEKDGLAARISVEHSNLAPESPIDLMLEIKNTSDKQLRAYREASGWEDVMIEPANGTEVIKAWVIPSDPKDPSLSDYTVLRPAEVLKHKLGVSVDEDLIVHAWNELRQFRGSGVLVHVAFTNGRFEPYGMDSGQIQSLAEIPIWKGYITTPPVLLRVCQPWTTRRIVQIVGILLIAVLGTAVLSEFVFRLLGARNQKAMAQA